MQPIHEQVKTDTALPVRFTVYDSDNDLIPMHWHNSMEIVYILNGIMDVTVNDRVTRLFGGDFVIVNSRDIHSTHCIGSSRILLLQLPYSFLKEHIPGYEFVRFQDTGGPFSFPGQNKLKPLLDQMAELYSDQSTIGRLKLTSLLYSLLSELVADYMVHISENAKLKNDRNFNRLSLIMDYVKEHYTENLSVSDAAGLLHLEEAYFCRFFKKYMGQTFLEYVNSVRLRYIYEDMMKTDLTLSEILERHGFHNYKVFSRMFKEIYGTTPGKKRKEQTEANTPT